MSLAPLLSARRGSVLTLTLNNPARRSALTAPMADGLTQALAEAALDPAVRAIVLCGSAGHFCSGADLAASIEGGDPSPEGRRQIVETVLVARFHPALRALWASPKPTVAAMAGASVGFGMSIALACDLRLMAEDAYLACGFLKRGLFPDGGALWLLQRLVGLARANELVLDPDRRLMAREAHAVGLSLPPVHASLLEAEAEKLAERLAAAPPLVVREAKRQLQAPRATFEAALEAEVEPVKDCLSSDDAAEGLMAFFEKRAPRFSGR
ncbi:MAG: enoyl-CoA hydratase/isomerase family protein [Deltaproteobacteria bacterium]